MHHSSRHKFAKAMAFSALFIAKSAFGQQKVDTLGIITAHPYSVTVLANGVDITQKSGIKTAIYKPDGSGIRIMLTGQQVAGSWRFMSPDKSTVEVIAPEGATQWRIVELNDNVYRKVLIANPKVEFIHKPILKE